MPLAGHRLRPPPLRQRAGRPQLKRDPLGGCQRRGTVIGARHTLRRTRPGLRRVRHEANSTSAAHALLFLFSSPKHGPEESAVVEAMKAHHFNFIGSMRSYWDFYFGYGLEAAFFCLLEAVLFWQLASIAKTAPLVIRPIVALFFLANIDHAILVVRYFFITPLVPDILIAACLAFAFMTAAA